MSTKKSDDVQFTIPAHVIAREIQRAIVEAPHSYGRSFMQTVIERVARESEPELERLAREAIAATLARSDFQEKISAAIDAAVLKGIDAGVGRAVSRYSDRQAGASMFNGGSR